MCSSLMTNKNLKEEFNVYFLEVASGVYKVVKDRFGKIGVDRFVDSKIVANTLNDCKKVVVLRLDGCVYVSN